MSEEKNLRIKDTIRATRERHSSMDCRVISVKVQESKLSKAKLENRKLNIQCQYTGSAEDMRMYLMLSHNSVQYTGDVSIYDFNRDCYIFEYRFTCSEEEDVIEVLDRLRRFGTMIVENTRKLYREIDSAAKQGYYI